jgi:hypothetical protein
MSADSFSEIGRFGCAFCKGQLIAGYSDPSDKDVPTLMHSAPPCRKFLDTEILEFLAENRITNAAMKMN